jgi:hypothetical protein
MLCFRQVLHTFQWSQHACCQQVLRTMAPVEHEVMFVVAFVSTEKRCL